MGYLDNVELQYNEALKKYNDGDFAGSEIIVNTALLVQPRHNLLLFMKAMLEEDYHENYEEAVKFYTKSIEIHPKYSRAYYNRAILYENRFQNYEQAYKDYTTAIQFNPDDSDAYINRGLLLEDKLNDRDNALKDYNKAIQVNPRDPDALNNRGVLFEKESRWKEAEENFDRAIRLAPDEFLCYNNRGFLFAQTRRFFLAKKNFIKAFSLYENGESCLGLCLVYLELGEAQNAKTHFDASKRYIDPSTPDNAFFMYINGRMSEDSGFLEEAKGFYEMYAKSKDYRPHYIEDSKRRLEKIKEMEVTEEVSPEEDESVVNIE